MGREYPKDPEKFRHRCHQAFMKNKNVEDPQRIEELIAHGHYILKELEALYMLKKYRTLKRRYYSQEETQRVKHLEDTIKDSL